MQYSRVTAIIGLDVREVVETRLYKAGIPGASVREVAARYPRDWLTNHVQVEIFVVREWAETIADVIMEVALTGGDAVVVTQPLSMRQPVHILPHIGPGQAQACRAQNRGGRLSVSRGQMPPPVASLHF
jgi:nitrogen regulatory protein PII